MASDEEEYASGSDWAGSSRSGDDYEEDFGLGDPAAVEEVVGGSGRAPYTVRGDPTMTTTQAATYGRSVNCTRT
jgi:hypothetical protein